jgi:two-component system OmpR family response regulator
MPRILIIDDEEDVLLVWGRLLVALGYEVAVMPNAARLELELQLHPPDLAVIDIMMPGMSGSGVYAMIRRLLGPYVAVLVSSGTRLRINNPEDPLLEHLPKPVDFAAVPELIRRMLMLRQAIIDAHLRRSQTSPDP